VTRILVLGATGYTGRLTARELVARGAKPLLLGRNEARLAPLADELGGLETHKVDVTQPGALAGLLEPGDTLVTTVGPFTTLGEPAVAAAAAAGVGYLDSTGEGPFLCRVFDEHGPVAAQTGARLIPAFGYDFVPGNLAAALALTGGEGSEPATDDRRGAEPATAVRIGYFIEGKSNRPTSRGTARSVLGLVGEPGYRLRDGVLRAEHVGARGARFLVSGKLRQAVNVGGTEQLVLTPNFPDLRDVDVYAGWFGAATGMVRATVPFSMLMERVPALGGAVRTWLAGTVERLPEGPDEAGAIRSYAVAETYDRAGRPLARARFTGPEPYLLTARLLALGALRLTAEPGPGGAFGPVAAFGVDGLREIATQAGLTPLSGSVRQAPE
jgi:short subunit dehydrogenase-like uncharacterized protein